MSCERKLSVLEPHALVALSVAIKRELSLAKVKGEWDMLPIDMTVFQLWIMTTLWRKRTGGGYMGLNTGFVKAGSLFALLLNHAVNLATGDRAWPHSSLT